MLLTPGAIVSIFSVNFYKLDPFIVVHYFSYCTKTTHLTKRVSNFTLKHLYKIEPRSCRVCYCVDQWKFYQHNFFALSTFEQQKSIGLNLACCQLIYFVLLQTADYICQDLPTHSGRRDTQHNDLHDNDTQQNVIRHNNNAHATHSLMA
jgi:hypothetical protein